MKWLKKHRIFLEENDLPTTFPATVGIVFFVHPRAWMMEIYHEQLKGMFIGKIAPEFKVRRILLKSGEVKAQVLIIQTVPAKANEAMHQFDEANEANPYEYISWKNWNAIHSTHKKNYDHSP
jgi:hypothetical protein